MFDRCHLLDYPPTANNSTISPLTVLVSPRSDSSLAIKRPLISQPGYASEEKTVISHPDHAREDKLYISADLSILIKDDSARGAGLRENQNRRVWYGQTTLAHTHKPQLCRSASDTTQQDKTGGKKMIQLSPSVQCPDAIVESLDSSLLQSSRHKPPPPPTPSIDHAAIINYMTGEIDRLQTDCAELAAALASERDRADAQRQRATMRLQAALSDNSKLRAELGQCRDKLEDLDAAAASIVPSSLNETPNRSSRQRGDPGLAITVSPTAGPDLGQEIQACGGGKSSGVHAGVLAVVELETQLRRQAEAMEGQVQQLQRQAEAMDALRAQVRSLADDNERLRSAKGGAAASDRQGGGQIVDAARVRALEAQVDAAMRAEADAAARLATLRTHERVRLEALEARAKQAERRWAQRVADLEASLAKQQHQQDVSNLKAAGAIAAARRPSNSRRKEAEIQHVASRSGWRAPVTPQSGPITPDPFGRALQSPPPDDPPSAASQAWGGRIKHAERNSLDRMSDSATLRAGSDRGSPSGTPAELGQRSDAGRQPSRGADAGGSPPADAGDNWGFYLARDIHREGEVFRGSRSQQPASGLSLSERQGPAF